MHKYYETSAPKIKKTMNDLLKLIAGELEDHSGKTYKELFCEIWNFYEKNLLEHFPYIGGDDASGTKNLTGAYYFVAMGEIIKNYGVDMNEIGRLMMLSYERKFLTMPKFVRKILGRFFNNPKLLNLIFKKKDAKNSTNAAKNPGSFETKTIFPPEKGYSFSYHNLICPLANFAKIYGYTEYMPYICNLDYVMFGVLGAPLYREHTIAAGDDYCDFKLKSGAATLKYWPPVFTQGEGYK
ncbi:MAG: L-2-amino-thiazoline-4-carboxylic acid hydrolase [Ruminococcaceae bacterium]|nr:L-2-amino-thiazoline-4-carboxylic acid hydrolase [Oscillospiraceae bacterium]